jgi:hypothetical protein
MGELNLYQNDPRWKDKPLGFGDAGSTIGLYGCLLTSLTMAANAYGANETPDSANEKMKAIQGFQNQWIKAFLIGKAIPNVRWVKAVDCEGDVPAPVAEIDSWLAGGGMVIVQVDYMPDPGIQGHWILIHNKQGNTYQIRDPWKSAQLRSTSLVERYGFGGNLEQLILSVIFVENPAAPVSTSAKAAPTTTTQAPAPQPSAAPKKTSLTVSTLIEALTFRAKPEINEANVIRRMSVGTKLLALEPEATARGKLGVKNQWLNVRDLAGQDGYAAAEYLTAVDQPASGVSPAPTGGRAAPSTTQLYVSTAKEGVTFRSAARATPDTVVKLLPLGTKLLVIESGNPSAKIGVQDQWLNVRDLTGAEGYVAAWFVVKST